MNNSFSGCAIDISGSLIDLPNNTIVSGSSVNESFFNILGRGGSYQYYWGNPQEPPVWFASGSPAQIPEWDATYFPVNPSKEKVEGYSRGKLDNVSGINCLYGDFDKKEGITKEDIENLDPPPSVVVDSGGGWHCYWLLQDPVFLTPENTQKMKELQSEWVGYIGSDPGAKDLTRILRVPGSHNKKYEEPREVKYIKVNLGLLYDISTLMDFLPAKENELKPELRQKNVSSKDVSFVMRYLELIPTEMADEYSSWIEVGMALRELGDIGFALWKQWSSQSYKFDENACEEKWESFDPASSQNGGLSLASLKYWAEKDKYQDDIRGELEIGSIKDAFAKRAQKKFLVENLIAEKGIYFFFGNYGHKKTFVAISLALNVASGNSWLGLRTIESPVLFVNEDTDKDSFLDRLKAGALGESLDDNIPLYYISNFNLNFANNEKDIFELEKSILQTNSKLVIIDALADIMAGVDENKVMDVQPIIMKLRGVAERTGSAIIILHHTNKDGGMRGSTAISAGGDGSIKIQSNIGSNQITFSTEKLRHSKPFDKIAHIEYINGEDSNLRKFYIVGDDSKEFIIETNDKEEIILEFARENGNEIVVVDFLKTVPWDDKESFRGHIYKLRDKGMLKKNEEKSGHNYAVYDLVV